MKILHEIQAVDFSEKIRRGEKERDYWNERREESRDDLHKATYWEPHCWSTWLCWEVSDESAGRPPCCSSDKKLNTCLLSELILNFIAFEILPISSSFPLPVCLVFQHGSWFCFTRLQWQVVNQHCGMKQYHMGPWELLGSGLYILGAEEDC